MKVPLLSFQRILNSSNSLKDMRGDVEMSIRGLIWKPGRGSFLNRIGRIKFFIGLLLIILNFILGKAAFPVLPISPNLSLLIYAISWAMLIVGIAMCGQDGWYKVKHWTTKFGRRIIDSFN